MKRKLHFLPYTFYVEIFPYSMKITFLVNLIKLWTHLDLFIDLVAMCNVLYLFNHEVTDIAECILAAH